MRFSLGDDAAASLQFRSPHAEGKLLSEPRYDQSQLVRCAERHYQ